MFALLQVGGSAFWALVICSFLFPAAFVFGAIPTNRLGNLQAGSFATAKKNSRDQSQLVKIRLAMSQQEVTLSGQGLQIRGEQDGIRIGNSLGSWPGRAREQGLLARYVVKARRVAGRVIWNIQSKENGRTLYRLLGERLHVRGEFVRVDVKSAPADLILIAEPSGHQPSFDVIGQLELETYLEGVLPSEMPPTWPMDAIKAQAIASRSYALARVLAREKAGSSFHLESSTMDQVYSHDQRAGGHDRIRVERVRQALKETKGLVLNDESGRVLTAYFHADCGGKTEQAGSVWGNESGGAGTVEDGSCPLSPLARWTWSITSDEIGSRLRIPLGLMPGSRLYDIRILDFTTSGRAQNVELTFGDGQVRKLTGHQIRTLLGFDKLKSTWFSVEKSLSGFRFAGRGHGHGVGLCQWGSRELARSGLDFHGILRHYYPQSSLRRQDESLGLARARSGRSISKVAPDFIPAKTL